MRAFKVNIMTLYFSSLCHNLMTNDVMSRGYQVYLPILYFAVNKMNIIMCTKWNRVDIADMSHEITYMKARQETPHETRWELVQWGVKVRIKRKWSVARCRSDNVAKCNAGCSWYITGLQMPSGQTIDRDGTSTKRDHFIYLVCNYNFCCSM